MKPSVLQETFCFATMNAGSHLLPASRGCYGRMQCCYGSCVSLRKLLETKNSQQLHQHGPYIGTSAWAMGAELWRLPALTVAWPSLGHWETELVALGRELPRFTPGCHPNLIFYVWHDVTKVGKHCSTGNGFQSWFRKRMKVEHCQESPE